MKEAYEGEAATSSAERADQFRALTYLRLYLNIGNQLRSLRDRVNANRKILLLEEKVIVPDLGGLPEEEAERLLDSVELRRGFRHWEPANGPRGSVSIQVPTPGEFLPRHSTVGVYLSAGTPKNGSKVPEDLVGKSGVDAKVELTRLGLDGQIVDAEGCASGTEVVFHWPLKEVELESGGPVYLFVGRKHEYPVPKVVERDYREYPGYEKEFKPFFLLSRQETKEGAAPWIYYDQDPKDGEKRSCGTWIIGYYSKQD